MPRTEDVRLNRYALFCLKMDPLRCSWVGTELVLRYCEQNCLRLAIPKLLGTQQGVVLRPDQPLFDAGFDSIMAEEFVGKLQERLITQAWGTEDMITSMVKSSLVFDAPTAGHMAEHLDAVLVGAGSAKRSVPMRCSARCEPSC